jgi:hypothetical protein
MAAGRRGLIAEVRVGEAIGGHEPIMDV